MPSAISERGSGRPAEVLIIPDGAAQPPRGGAPTALEAADLVSEVVKVKHPMDAGIRAQQGIEW